MSAKTNASPVWPLHRANSWSRPGARPWSTFCFGKRSASRDAPSIAGRCNPFPELFWRGLGTITRFRPRPMPRANMHSSRTPARCSSGSFPRDRMCLWRFPTSDDSQRPFRRVTAPALGKGADASRPHGRCRRQTGRRCSSRSLLGRHRIGESALGRHTFPNWEVRILGR